MYQSLSIQFFSSDTAFANHCHWFPCIRRLLLWNVLSGFITPYTRLVDRKQMAVLFAVAGLVLWTNNLHGWQLYQPDLVHYFIDVCLEGLDYQLGELPASIFWFLASFLHSAYPWPELRLRIARRMLDIAGIAKEQEIVRTALHALCHLEPVCQCIDRHFLAEFVRIMTSDEALFSLCLFKVTDMADVVLADDLARLVAFRRHLSRAFFKPEMLSEVRHELLEMLAEWPASGCAKRLRLG